jgi:hypothetical protein
MHTYLRTYIHGWMDGLGEDGSRNAPRRPWLALPTLLCLIHHRPLYKKSFICSNPKHSFPSGPEIGARKEERIFPRVKGERGWEVVARHGRDREIGSSTQPFLPQLDDTLLGQFRYKPDKNQL